DLGKIDRRELREVLRAEQALLLATVPEKHDRTLRPYSLGRSGSVSMRHRQQADGTRSVIVRAIVDVVSIGQRRAQANVIEMRTHNDIFIFEDRIAAFQ